MLASAQFFRRFTSSRDGAIAPLFGVCIASLIMLTGVAIDGARGYRTSSEAGVALDAAALASAKALRLQNLSDEELRKLAVDYFADNFKFANESEKITIERVDMTIDRKLYKVTLKAYLKLPTTIAAMLGKDVIDISTQSTAIYDSREVELAMMLDVSGSMKGSKLSDLKAAAGDLVKILIEGNKSGSKHRIGIAPFSTAVNAGEYAGEIVEKKDSKGKKYAGAGTTCVTDRFGSHAFTDKNPNSGKFGQRSSSCPESSVMPLSDDDEELVGHINAMKADGMTAGHLGIAWAWYLLAPEWDRLWPEESAPKEYNDPEYTKVAILMTDGQFNNFYEPDNGNAEAQARKLCDNMRASGITIYTVGFQVPKEALPILEYCASSPSHFFDAKDGSQLRQTFQTIAKRLSGLRLAS